MSSLLPLWWFAALGQGQHQGQHRGQGRRRWRRNPGAGQGTAATLAASLLLSASLWLLPLLAGPGLATALLAGRPAAAAAAPGLCVGPVCGDQFSPSAQHVFRLRLRLRDQRGHQERITVDCRDGQISPAMGPVERGYGAAVARRACRLVGGSPS